MADNLQSGYDLDRFLEAQAGIYGDVVRELAAGRKESHWMWFIFPQIEGLGRSGMAQRYAIASLAEARAYLGHPALGARLLECTDLVNRIEGKEAGQIFGYPDDLKFGSSMTLFAHAGPEQPAFREALEKYFGGREDRLTLERLK